MSPRKPLIVFFSMCGNPFKELIEQYGFCKGTIL